MPVREFRGAAGGTVLMGAAAGYLASVVGPPVRALESEFDVSLTEIGLLTSSFFAGVAWFDTHVVDGAVNGVAHLVAGFGRRLRHVQSGFVRTYALGVATGVVVVLGYFLTRIRF